MCQLYTHTQPKMPQKCCKLLILPACCKSCQQVARNLSTSSSCDMSVKIRLELVTNEAGCNLSFADLLYNLLKQLVETTTCNKSVDNLQQTCRQH